MRIKDKVRFDELDINQVVEKVIDRETYGYVVTPNVDHVCRIVKDNNLKRIYDESWISICDSKVLQILFKIKGISIKNVVRGSDLTEKLLVEIDKREKLIIVSDSDEHAIEIKEKYNFDNVKSIVPSFGFVESEMEINEIVNKIK